jgi:hypothetical protein
MSTLALNRRRPARPQIFGRVAHALAVFLDVFTEAQKMAGEAHRRFPFGRW